MNTRDSISLHEELIKLQDHGSLLIAEEIYISDLAVPVVTDKLNEVVDSLQADPASILHPRNLDAAKSFLKYMKDLTDENKCKFVDILISAFKAFLVHLVEDISSQNTLSFNIHKQTLEVYVLLWYCTVIEAESLWKDRKDGKTPAFLLKKQRDDGKIPARRAAAANWNWASSRIASVMVAHKLISVDMRPLYPHQSDLDIVLNIILKTIFVIMDDPEIIKDASLSEMLVEALVLCSVEHESTLGSSIESKIFHDYLREESLVDFAVMFAKKLCSTTEKKMIVENILRRLAIITINSDDTPIAKTISRFLIRMSVFLPKEVLKQMVHLQSLLYSGSYTIRLTIIEVMGNLIYSTLNSSNQVESFSSIESYYQIFKERSRDISSNVRAKVLQTINKLSERRRENSSSTYIPLNLRPHFVEMAVGRLLDKSTNVRRNAIRLLVRLIETAPFVLQRDSGSLSLKLLSSRRDQLTQLVQAKFGNVTQNSGSWEDPKDQYNNSDMDVDVNENMNDARTEASDIAATSRSLNRIRALLIYYTDAISFVESIEGTLGTMLQLTMSNYKGEAVEAMKFFITCDRYEMEFAKVGIKNMIHKIWDKDTGEFGRMSVRDTLVKCYVELYMQKDGIDLGPEAVADNLVNCVLDMSLSELTSLEQLLCSIYETHIPNRTVQHLWKIFSAPNEIYQKKLGAIIVLGSLTRADPTIITHNIRYFLDFFCCRDPSTGLLPSKYVCSAIAQLKNATAKESNSVRESEHSEQLVTHISNLILESYSSDDWFGCAEQAISAIYIVSKFPGKVCAEIIRSLASRCFPKDFLQKIIDYKILNPEGSVQSMGHEDKPEQCAEPLSFGVSKLDLSKLFFVVGHVAAKQIVYLEDAEQEWKQVRQAEISRLQSEASKVKSKPVTEEIEALMNTEDKIASYMQNVKERELLYGKNSLLGLFAHMISYACANGDTLGGPPLHNISIISLCKLMCISPTFCEKNLHILLSTLESSCNPTIRNNIIIGLGDLTMCFNSLLDKHMTRLYDRLDDIDPSVRKSALTLLSFLILNGMVRIRGQISTMVKCLSDPDSSVKNVARLFFSEFSSKDNSIYNNLVDIISNLSNASSGVSEQDFQSIFKIILDFVKKEKFTENLIEKLCQRLRDSNVPCQSRNLSFCLSYLVQNSDRCMKKFVDCLPYYSSRLDDSAILSLFLDVCARYKKSASQDLKQYIENFENSLRTIGEKFSSNAMAEDATQAAEKEIEYMDTGIVEQ